MSTLKYIIIWHSLRFNVEVVVSARQILGSLVVGVKIVLQVVILFFTCLVRNLQTKWKKMSKINSIVALWKVLLRREDNVRLSLKSDLVWLEMKLHEVHFTVKFSKAEAHPRLRRTWLQSVQSAISSQCQWGGSQVARAAGEGYLENITFFVCKKNFFQKVPIFWRKKVIYWDFSEFLLQDWAGLESSSQIA